MSIRKASLFVAIGLGLGLFRHVYSFSTNVYLHGIRSLDSILPAIGLLAAGIAATLFFVFLYREASRLTVANTRVQVATASALLMFVQVICAGWEVTQIMSASMLPNASVVLVKQILFGLVLSIGWTMLFLAFAERPTVPLRSMVPSLAGFVAVMSVLSTVAAYLFPASAHHLHASSPIVLSNVVLSLYTTVSLLVFFIVVWRKWDSRMPVHEIVVGRG